MHSLTFFFIFLSTIYCIGGVSGLSCYKCSVPRPKENGELDLTCVTAPWKIAGSVKTCLPHQKACKTTRINHKGSGQIRSFVRECSSPGENLIEDKPSYIIYHQYCLTNMCNVGDGISNGTDGANERITAILIPDVSSSGISMSQRNLLFVVSALLCWFSR